MNLLKQRLLLEWLGFCEKRCSCCSEPFFAGAYSNSQDFAASGICPDCQKLLGPYLGPACRACGVPWEEGVYCPACAARMPPWSGFASYGLYSGQLRELLLRLKFGAELHLASVLAQFAFRAAERLPIPDVITAIPQYPAHLRRRGFNQAHEIARRVAALAGLDYRHRLLWRVKPSKPQEGLSAIERKRNQAETFSAAPGRGLTIWLVDDIMTTGSTCAAATEALLAAGASAVYILCVARTPLDKGKTAA